MGFIPKSSTADVMLSALRLVFSGGVYLPSLMLGQPAPDRAAGPRPAARVEDLGLTPRQYEVLTLLGQGKSNKEIAQALGLAEGTVKLHVSAILKALNASNRTHAVIMAGRLLGRKEARD